MAGTPGLRLVLLRTRSRVFAPLSQTAIGTARQHNWQRGTIPAGQKHQGVLQRVGCMSGEPAAAVRSCLRVQLLRGRSTC